MFNRSMADLFTGDKDKTNIEDSNFPCKQTEIQVTSHAEGRASAGSSTLSPKSG